MPDYRTYFNGKKITLMGLGLLGRGLGDAVFLAQQGAELTVTDLRDEPTLAPSLIKLKKYNNIRYRLSEHRLKDFRNRDFILKAAGVSLDSPFIREAKKHGIPIEMDASLFAKLIPKGVMLVGITGTRGKSTTAECIHAILKAAKRQVFLGGVVHTATLPLLAQVKAGDIVVLELDSWQLQGFRDSRISPQMGVFTTFLDDHLVYYHGNRKRYFDDKAAIFRYQKLSDVLIVGEQAAKLVLKARPPVSPIIARAVNIPSSWKLRMPGSHNRQNAACALAVARALKIPDPISRKTIESFKGIPGRLEYLKTVRGIKIYNDNNATTPDATLAALRALSTKSEIPSRASPMGFSRNPKQIQNPKSQILKKIILIMGGTDKGLDMSELVTEIPKHCRGVILLKESGTDKIKERIWNLEYGIQIAEKDTLKECVEEAMNIAKKGDVLLFSPAFASFGQWFKNEYDRGEQFVKIIESLGKSKDEWLHTKA